MGLHRVRLGDDGSTEIQLNLIADNNDYIAVGYVANAA
jgi:hypothetical protein